jgi:hypothetical protein
LVERGPEKAGVASPILALGTTHLHYLASLHVNGKIDCRGGRDTGHTKGNNDVRVGSRWSAWIMDSTSSTAPSAAARTNREQQNNSEHCESSAPTAASGVEARK